MPEEPLDPPPWWERPMLTRPMLQTSVLVVAALGFAATLAGYLASLHLAASSPRAATPPSLAASLAALTTLIVVGRLASLILGVRFVYAALRMKLHAIPNTLAKHLITRWNPFDGWRRTDLTPRGLRYRSLAIDSFGFAMICALVEGILWGALRWVSLS